MNHLGNRNYLLIVDAVAMMGTFNPKEIFCIFVESLYEDEADEIYQFLTWCHENKKSFGSKNYDEVFTEFKKDNKCLILEKTH